MLYIKSLLLTDGVCTLNRLAMCILLYTKPKNINLYTLEKFIPLRKIYKRLGIRIIFFFQSSYYLRRHETVINKHVQYSRQQQLTHILKRKENENQKCLTIRKKKVLIDVHHLSLNIGQVYFEIFITDFIQNVSKKRNL